MCVIATEGFIAWNIALPILLSPVFFVFPLFSRCFRFSVSVTSDPVLPVLPLIRVLLERVAASSPSQSHDLLRRDFGDLSSFSETMSFRCTLLWSWAFKVFSSSFRVFSLLSRAFSVSSEPSMVEFDFVLLVDSDFSVLILLSESLSTKPLSGLLGRLLLRCRSWSSRLISALIRLLIGLISLFRTIVDGFINIFSLGAVATLIFVPFGLA